MTAAARMQLLSELATLVKSQDAALHDLVARTLQSALESRDAWCVQHASWIAKHLRSRTGFEKAIEMILQTALELEQP